MTFFWFPSLLPSKKHDLVTQFIDFFMCVCVRLCGKSPPVVNSIHCCCCCLDSGETCNPIASHEMKLLFLLITNKLNYVLYREYWDYGLHPNEREKNLLYFYKKKYWEIFLKVIAINFRPLISQSISWIYLFNKKFQNLSKTHKN